MKKISKYIRIFYTLLILTLLLQERTLTQQLYINEFMASNSSTIKDPDYNDYADWIEIYNPNLSEINLKNYTITDNLSQPAKYRFIVDLLIPANGYIIIWADDRGVGRHTNYKLSASGESIGLFDPSGILIDTLTFSLQQNDISEGRFPDGATSRFQFYPSTPGSQNLESSIFNRVEEPILSHNSGFFSSSQSVTIQNHSSDIIYRYTTDGKIPTESSLLYSSSLGIDSTTTLRIRAFKNGFVPSYVITATYFINENSELPIFSIVTDPDNFFSDTSGIYVIGTNGIISHCSSAPRNWNQDWEQPVHLEFFEADKTPAFKVNTGVKIYGGCTRLYPMKSLAFYFRGQYGNSKLNYRLFPSIPVAEYNSFILRSSGQDWWRTMFRDGMVQTVIKQGMKLDYSEYRPSVVFLNGQYWGIHNIREKLNEHYVYYHHGVNKDNIDLIEISKNVKANAGDVIAYNNMINFISTKNMSMLVNYDYIKSIVDIDEYIDYQIAQIYSANGDWPGSNMKLWRERSSNGKWRWMIYDLDFTFGGNSQGLATTNTLAQATATNGPDWPNPPWSTLMLRKLLENTEFKNEFIQRFAAHLNTTFEPEHILNVIDSLANIISNEIPRHKDRWEQSISYGTSWLGNIQIMKDFAVNRPGNSIGHFLQKFNLSGTSTLTLSRNNIQWGKIFTNSVEIKKNNSTNIFFKSVPVKVKALAMPGYRFVRWDGISNSTNPEIAIILTNATELTAIFEEDELVYSSIIINEINYKSSPLFDTEDWVEFYNPLDQSVDISGWKFRDEDISNTYTFPLGTIINGKNYLVLCRDSVRFKYFYPNLNNIVGNISFGLSSDGEMIKLFNSTNELIDEVTYSSSGNWTNLPNGNGPTLSLINPQTDNSIAENWKASGLYGTPGRLNDVYTKGEEEFTNLPNEFMLFQNYPNPFNPITYIEYATDQPAIVTLSIYDVLGNLVSSLVNEYKTSGKYSVKFDANQLTSGIYFYRLTSGNNQSVKKMLLIR
ncbi:MAG: CotH kinase family protein [Ignavibacteria bacterium]|nr:CotH kinase family protein [Ignavibacteria bacterium]